MTPDLEVRRRVWNALAELFLDTEIDLEWVARELRESGLSRAEVEAILKREVAPVVGGNVLGMAGEWAGFDLPPLEERYLAGRARPTLTGWLALRVIRQDWQRVSSKLP